MKKPRGIRHDRHCHRCHSKGLKCDLNRPRCQPCQQEGTTCSYPQRLVWMGAKKESPRKTSSCTAPSAASSSSPAAADLGLGRIELPNKNIPINLYGFIDLLSHFYREIQASEQELPAEAVKLISRTLNFARSRLRGSDNKQSIQTHLGALTNLSKVIESGHPIALFGIATFAIFEVCCGSFGRWHRHLQGARSLLDLHCQNKEQLDQLAARIPGLGDILAYLVWFDVTGALVRKSPLLFDDWHRQILGPSFYDSVGCPADTFELFVHLAKDVNINVLDLSARAMDQIISLDSGDQTEIGLATVVFRCTGAIGAFSRAGSKQEETSSVHSGILSKMIDRVCDAISKMPTSSRFYVHLATPAFLIGMHATNAEQCESLRAYWRNCQQCDFPRYPDAQEQCERRWRSRMIFSE
ncbi:hypothetical protein N7540_001874 [Penicillium herquei]|nr:hypothetical protein N7540_001874 [Penicillium herquei]